MKGVKFKVPGSVKHEETKRFMRDVVKKLNQEEAIDSTDIPNLHRMATSYDLYLTACEWLSENGPITVNKKGEQVKHPYVNISRESWNQFLELAKQYGLTIKSKAQIKAHAPVEKKDDTPLDEYMREKMNRG